MAKRGLGRGLGSLIPGLSLGMEEGLKELPLSTIVANRRQPRRYFDQESIAALAESIASHGVVQPIVVRPCGEQYEIIAGERRWRAAVRAGVATIPAVIRKSDDQQSLQLALIENLQRDDLSAIEEAQAYKMLIDEYDMTHEDLSRAVGRSRTAISNTMRLLNLPENIRHMIAEGELSAGHARAMLAVEDETERELLLSKVVNEGLSVRQAEGMVRRQSDDPTPASAHKIPEDVLETVRLIKSKLGTEVKVRYKDGSGRLEIKFADQEELTTLADKIYLLPD